MTRPRVGDGHTVPRSPRPPSVHRSHAAPRGRGPPARAARRVNSALPPQSAGAVVRGHAALSEATARARRSRCTRRCSESQRPRHQGALGTKPQRESHRKTPTTTGETNCVRRSLSHNYPLSQCWLLGCSRGLPAGEGGRPPDAEGRRWPEEA